jgi:hypothetical protein
MALLLRLEWVHLDDDDEGSSCSVKRELARLRGQCTGRRAAVMVFMMASNGRSALALCPCRADTSRRPAARCSMHEVVCYALLHEQVSP